VAQFEKGHVKILQDRRYQDGASFGNLRDQEDGIKYQEETGADGVRRGFWEYPDQAGNINRVEFEAGKGIGFRIVSSNIVEATPVAALQPAAPFHQPRANPVRVSRPVQASPVRTAQPKPAPRPTPQPTSRPAPRPTTRRPAPLIRTAPSTTTPRGPIFDYPANLDFTRTAQGHSFKFTAV